jgi:hypothetical protein
MRRRITRTLLAAGAAGVTATALAFTAAGAASAASTASAAAHFYTPSGGAPIYTDANCGPLTCAMAGYQASGRYFRYAQALIKVPTWQGVVDTSPDFYVGLNDGTITTTGYPDGYAHIGIEPCFDTIGCSSDGWMGYYDVYQGGTPDIYVYFSLGAAHAGDGVLFSVYFNAEGNALRFVAAFPNGPTYSRTVAVNGPIYNSAVAEADWSYDDNSPIPVAPPATTRLTQFLQGRFTTVSGAQGTFQGPWALNPFVTTSNGQAPPFGARIAGPGALWSDGHSLMGLPGDAFGVWLYNA